MQEQDSLVATKRTNQKQSEISVLTEIKVQFCKYILKRLQATPEGNVPKTQ